MPQIVDIDGKKINATTSSLNNLNIDPKTSFFNSLKFYLNNWLESTTICVYLKPSYPNIVLDFDNLEFLFSQNSNEILGNFIEKILQWKNEGFVIFSSPTKEKIQKFKIIFSIKGFNNLKDFENFIKSIDFGKFCISYEDFVSVFGSNLRGQNLKTDFNLTKIPEVSSEDLKILTTPSFINKDLYFEKLSEFLEILDDKTSIHLEKYFLPNSKLPNSIKISSSCLPNKDPISLEKILTLKENFLEF